ncbi:MAG: hypothetical protein M0R80_08470 [Proteobacteria bacterium]|jgi:hypothetical protein|nr:hypothetical protein [Pseudomonadota bacterium]
MEKKSLKKRILFVCKKHHLYGHHHHHENKCSGLFNSASFVASYLRSQGHDAKVINAIDGNNVDRIVTEFNPHFVIIEALWITPEKMRELLDIPRHKNRLWIIRIHSKLTFLASEGMAFEWFAGYRELMKAHKNLYVAPNTSELTEDLENIFKLRSIFLPNVYTNESMNLLEHEQHNDNPHLHKQVINIGCFGAIRPMKNILTQAIAAVEFAKNANLEVHFHINAGRVEQNGESVLKNLRAFFNGLQHHVLVEHPWLEYEEFIQLVKTMDIGMQVSLCETFNIVSADFVSNKIPLVGSKEISWLPAMFCADDTSTKDIADHLEYAWTQPGYMLRHLSKRALHAYNTDSEDKWNQVLKMW